MTNEERNVVEAAVEIREFMPVISIIEGSYKDNFVKAVDTYLASQKEVKEIEPVSTLEFYEGQSVIPQFTNKLNEVISAVNKLSRGK